MVGGGAMRDGYRTAADLLTAEERRALQQEALGLRDKAEMSERSNYVLVDGVQLLSPARNRYVQAGEIRDELHGVLAERLSGSLHRSMRPALSSYLVYRRGDFIGLHVDQRICSLTVLVLLDGGAGPLHVHPELRGVPPAQLLRHSREHAGHPPGGIPVFLRDGPLLLLGGELPHNRPAHRADSEILLAAFCYFLMDLADPPVQG